MNYWLMKSEPETFGIEHLKQRPKKIEPWDGVRNYQARNMMRDDMQVGDKAFFITPIARSLALSVLWKL